MQLTSILSRAASILAAAILAVILSAGIGLAATNEYVGTWKVQDTQGKPMEITLSEDGAAKGTREDEGLKGTWKAEGSIVTITWESGWTTKITKEGNQFKKLAYEKGKPVGTATEAQKVE